MKFDGRVGGRWMGTNCGASVLTGSSDEYFAERERLLSLSALPEPDPELLRAIESPLRVSMARRARILFARRRLRGPES